MITNPKVYTYITDMRSRCDWSRKREGRRWYKATAKIDSARNTYEWVAYGKTKRLALRRLRREMVDPKRVDS
jgi:hypothetical protein